MTKPAQALLEEAMKLGVAERAELAAELLASLDGEPEKDVEAAWAAELRARVARIEAGEEQLIPWEEVRRRVDERLQRR